MLDKPNEGC